MKSLVVLISGKQGSGKTSLSKAITEKLQAWEHNLNIVMPLTFAEPLYKMHNAVRDICNDYNLSDFDKDGPLLQYLGTEFGRTRFGKEVWVTVAKNRITQIYRLFDDKKYVIPIISDCRFQNEVLGFPHALKIRLECPEEVRKARICATPGQHWRENREHQSEIDLDYFEGWNMVIDTEKTSTDDAAKMIESEVVLQLHHHLKKDYVKGKEVW